MADSGAALRPFGSAQLERLLAWRGLPTLLNFTALVVLTYGLAQWTWRLWQPTLEPAPRSASTAAAPLAPDYNVKPVLDLHLFGRAAPPVTTLSLDTIPVTSLNLRLSGVVVAGGASYALLSIQDGPETPVALGQEIVSGATLRSVYPDRILIQRGAAVESLFFKDVEGAQISYLPSPPATAATAAVQPLGGQSYSVDRAQLMQQMQRPDFLRQAHIVPLAAGGFLVREVQAGSVYEKLGLRVGDVIRTVNGQAIQGIDDVMRLYQQMGGAQEIDQLSVEVTRAGRTEQLFYNIH